ncbi:MAG TPA: BA14K family protein, partial [Stellaceae bacterium]|nr:BA14K family protein [Stellaceae bacterium]
AVAPATNSAPPQPGDEARLDEQASQGSSEPSNPACDVQACSSFYHSFRQSDCTYQPYDGGPRQICEKTSGQSDAGHSTSGESTSGPSPAPQSTPVRQTAKLASNSGNAGQCNVELCSQTYSSFNPSDCTYQPYGGGPRQLCDK